MKKREKKEKKITEYLPPIEEPRRPYVPLPTGYYYAIEFRDSIPITEDDPLKRVANEAFLNIEQGRIRGRRIG